MLKFQGHEQLSGTNNIDQQFGEQVRILPVQGSNIISEKE
jgi:hypothetical protein